MAGNSTNMPPPFTRTVGTQAQYDFRRALSNSHTAQELQGRFWRTHTGVTFKGVAYRGTLFEIFQHHGKNDKSLRDVITKEWRKACEAHTARGAPAPATTQSVGLQPQLIGPSPTQTAANPTAPAI